MRSRRDEYSEATRRALLDSATSLFAADGFSNTSLDRVAVNARLTKGAVYHHFAHKQALFQAVLEELDARTVELILARASDNASTWDGALAGLDGFLDRCLDPTYQRICFQEGPSALGFVPWWEHGETHVAGLMKLMLTALRDEGLIDLEDLEVLSTVVYGALTAGALAISRSKHPKATRDGIRTTIVRLIEGLHPPGSTRRRPRR